MLVSHILEKKGSDVVTTTPGTSIIRVARLFLSAHIGAAVVLDDGRTIVGLVSERDITHHIARARDEALIATAGEIMSTPVVTCKSDDKISDIMELMTRQRVRHLPVVSDGNLAGIVSIGDVVKHCLDENALEINVLRDVARAHAPS